MFGIPTGGIERAYAGWREAVAEDGAEEAGRFGLPFAPSFLCKVEESGGGPSRVLLPDAGADATLLFEEAFLDAEWVDRTAKGIWRIGPWQHGLEVYLVDYLRECFRWGGFPGIATPENRPYQARALELAQGLLPI